MKTQQSSISIYYNGLCVCNAFFVDKIKTPKNKKDFIISLRKIADLLEREDVINDTTAMLFQE